MDWVPAVTEAHDWDDEDGIVHHTILPNIVQCISCGTERHKANMMCVLTEEDEVVYVCPECRYGI